MTTTILRLGVGFLAFQGPAVPALGFVEGLSTAGFSAGVAAVYMTTIAGAAKIKQGLTPTTTYAD